MMFLRRSPIGLFLMVGFGLLLGAALFGGTEAVGSVVAAPFLVLGFMFKVVLFFMLFGLAAKMFAGSVRRDRRTRNWCGPSREWWSDEARSPWSRRGTSSESDRDESRNDRFEEWHRMAHARQEVDDHTPPVED
jgi:hypothetical protein